VLDNNKQKTLQQGQITVKIAANEMINGTNPITLIHTPCPQYAIPPIDNYQ
jgi:hypothetical protein